MGSLTTLLRQQKTQGIMFDKQQLETAYPFEMWLNALSSPTMLGTEAYLATTQRGRAECAAHRLAYSRPYCCTPEGRISYDYYTLVLARAAINGDMKCPNVEKNLINALTYYVGAVQLNEQVKHLKSICSKKTCSVSVSFDYRDGVFQPSTGNRIFNMSVILPLIRNDNRLRYFRIDANDTIIPAMWRNVWGWDDEDVAKRLAKGIKFNLLNGVDNNLAAKIAPQVFKQDFAMTSRFLRSTIEGYLSGKCIGYRESDRGRKPKMTDTYYERIYPIYEKAMDARIDLVKNAIAANNYMPSDVKFVYANPLFVVVGVRMSDKGIWSTMKPVLTEAKANYVNKFTPAGISSGLFL